MAKGKKTGGSLKGAPNKVTTGRGRDAQPEKSALWTACLGIALNAESMRCTPEPSQSAISAMAVGTRGTLAQRVLS